MPSRKKRPQRGRRRNVRMPRMSALTIGSRPSGVGPVFRFRRTVLNSYAMVAGSPSLLAMSFGLGNVPSNLTTFVQTWDIYRITKLKVNFIPHWNVNGTNSVGADDELPQITWYQNHDDTVLPTSFDQVSGATGSKVLLFDRVRSTTIIPNVLLNVAASGGNSNAGFAPGIWLNTTGNLALYLGLKIAVQAVAGIPASGRFDIDVVYHFEVAQATTG